MNLISIAFGFHIQLSQNSQFLIYCATQDVSDYNTAMHSITTVTRNAFTGYIISQNFTDLCEINCSFGPISETQSFITTE